MPMNHRFQFFSDSFTRMQDMWVLHTVDPLTGQNVCRWEQIPQIVDATGNAQTWPTPRSGHACEVFDNYMLVFGGRYRHGRFNDTYLFNYASRSWAKITPLGDSFKARKTHAVGRVGSKIYLYGGHDGERWLGDLHVFDLLPLAQSLFPATTVPTVTTATNEQRSAPHVMTTSGIGSHVSYVRVGGPPRVAKDIDQCLQQSGSAVSGNCPLLSNSVAVHPSQYLACDPPTAHLLPHRYAGSAEAAHNGRATNTSTCTSGLLSVYQDCASMLNLQCNNYHNRSDAPNNVRRLEHEKSVARESARCHYLTSSVPDSGFDRAWTGAATTSGLSANQSTDFDDIWNASDEVLLSEYCVEGITWPAPVVTPYQSRSVADTTRAMHRHSRVAGGESMQPTAAIPVSAGEGSVELVLPKQVISLPSRVDFGGIARCAVPYTNPESFADVAFHVENHLVHLHRSLLAARSPYFRAMLAGTMAETQQLVIPLPDISLNVFMVLVRYLYFDTLPTQEELHESCSDILSEAHKVQLCAVSLACQQFLEQRLCADNAISLLQFADFLGARFLKRACMRFVLAHYSYISGTMEFIGLKEALLRQILYAHSKARRSAITSGDAAPVAAPVLPIAPRFISEPQVAAVERQPDARGIFRHAQPIVHSPPQLLGLLREPVRENFLRPTNILNRLQYFNPRLAPISSIRRGFGTNAVPQPEEPRPAEVYAAPPLLNVESPDGVLTGTPEQPPSMFLQQYRPVERSWSDGAPPVRTGKRSRNDFLRSVSADPSSEHMNQTPAFRVRRQPEDWPSGVTDSSGGQSASAAADAPAQEDSIASFEVPPEEIEDKRQLEPDEIDASDREDEHTVPSQC
jgi:hypothetical protein